VASLGSRFRIPYAASQHERATLATSRYQSPVDNVLMSRKVEHNVLMSRKIERGMGLIIQKKVEELYKG
jgi:hypothetical protein